MPLSYIQFDPFAKTVQLMDAHMCTAQLLFQVLVLQHSRAPVSALGAKKLVLTALSHPTSFHVYGRTEPMVTHLLAWCLNHLWNLCMHMKLNFNMIKII